MKRSVATGSGRHCTQDRNQLAKLTANRSCSSSHVLWSEIRRSPTKRLFIIPVWASKCLFPLQMCLLLQAFFFFRILEVHPPPPRNLAWHAVAYGAYLPPMTYGAPANHEIVVEGNRRPWFFFAPSFAGWLARAETHTEHSCSFAIETIDLWDCQRSDRFLFVFCV